MSNEKRPVWDPDGIVSEKEAFSLVYEIDLKYRDRASECRVIAHTPLLWSGWECDSAITLIEIDGRREILVSAGVAHPGDEGPAAMLRERIQAYRDAIALSEDFLAKLEEADD